MIISFSESDSNITFSKKNVYIIVYIQTYVGGQGFIHQHMLTESRGSADMLVYAHQHMWINMLRCTDPNPEGVWFSLSFV